MPEDPFSMNQFDSGMIDLTNPSEIFQFDKDDCNGSYAIGGDESVQLQQNYQDFQQVNPAAFDIDPKQRLDFVGYI